jgi:dihydrofolate reductase
VSRVRINVAASADGFVADAAGGLDWLAPFDPASYGMPAFHESVGSVVLGRRAFEFTRLFEDWPYAGRPAFVVASRSVGDLPEGARVVRNLTQAIAAARAASPSDVWLVGGTMLMTSALDAGLADLLEVCVMPVLLGRGLSLFGSLDRPVGLALDGIEMFQNNVVRLAYRPVGQRMA